MSQVNINSDIHETRANEVVIFSDREPAQILGSGLRFNPLPGNDASTAYEINKTKEKYINKVMTTSNSVIPPNKLVLCLTRINDNLKWEFGMQTSEALNDFTVGGGGGAPTWAVGTIPVDFRPTAQVSVPISVLKDTGERETNFLIFDEDGSIGMNIGNSTLWAAGNKLNIARGSGEITMNVV